MFILKVFIVLILLQFSACGTDFRRTFPHYRHIDCPTARQCGTDVPVHSGIHRIGESGHPRALLVRTFLEEDHQQRRHYGRGAIHPHRIGTQVLAYRHALYLSAPDVSHI